MHVFMYIYNDSYHNKINYSFKIQPYNVQLIHVLFGFFDFLNLLFAACNKCHKTFIETKAILSDKLVILRLSNY